MNKLGWTNRSNSLLFPAFGLILGTSAHCNEVTLQRPDLLDDGWPVSTLELENISAARMEDVQSFIREDPNQDFRGLLIARDGNLVYEGYFNGHDRESLHDIRSATKSLTSTLVGIAISKGLLGSVDSKMLTYLSAYDAGIHDNALKREISIEHLLSMTSGLDADEDDPFSSGFEDKLYKSGDWVKFALNLPMASTPGQRWAYASVNTFLLGVALEDTSGEPLSVFANKHLFGPLGITQYRWASSPTGHTVAQGNLSLRLRDMGKFGQLFLNRGIWGDEQVVPEIWTRESVVGRFSVPWDDYDEYGYGWYVHTVTVLGQEFQYFFASGNGGNKIYAIPEVNMVVAIQSAAYNTDYGQSRSLDVLKSVLEALITTSQRDASGNECSRSLDAKVYDDVRLHCQ